MEDGSIASRWPLEDSLPMLSRRVPDETLVTVGRDGGEDEDTDEDDADDDDDEEEEEGDDDDGDGTCRRIANL